MSTGTVLGFDFGTRRIGVAVGERATATAHPLDTVTVTRNRPDWLHIGKLIDTWRPAAAVVGLPLNMDLSPTALAPAARRFGDRLAGRYHLPVHMVDERLTSRAAADALREAGASRRRFRTAINALAAQQILQRFLDASSEFAGDPIR